jgi:hypothetical protein
MIEYLEDLLRRAREGEVLFFIGSAGVITSTELAILVAITQAPQSQVIDKDTLRNGFVAVARGVASATESLQAGVEREIAARGGQAS